MFKSGKRIFLYMKNKKKLDLLLLEWQTYCYRQL